MQQTDTIDITLPIGYTDSKGNWYDKVTIREFIGRDNQALTSPEARNNNIRGISQLISNVVKRIYNSKEPELSINKPTFDHARDMFVGDRDQILIELRKLSMGNEVTIEFTCRGCDSVVKFELPLNDDSLNIKRADSFPPNPFFNVELKRGIVGFDGKVYKDIVMTYLRGYQLEQIVNAGKSDPAKGAMIAIYQSIVEVVGMPKEQLNLDLIAMSKKVDFDILSKAIYENRLGPDMQPETVCGICDTKTPIPLVVGVLFRSA